MVNMSNTKAQLLAHIAVLEAGAIADARYADKLRSDLVFAQSAPVLPAGRAPHAAYYDYVRAQRLAQRGQRVCAYKSFAQWSAA